MAKPPREKHIANLVTLTTGVPADSVGWYRTVDRQRGRTVRAHNTERQLQWQQRSLQRAGATGGHGEPLSTFELA